MSFCYPERYFGGNQLLDCSMSLSPLYSTLTSDLHVSTVRRSSIKVSFDFYHVKYRSQPFGSCRLYSHSWLRYFVTCVQYLLVRWVLYILLKITFITSFGFKNRMTCINDKFLGPCFKTGRNKRFINLVTTLKGITDIHTLNKKSNVSKTGYFWRKTLLVALIPLFVIVLVVDILSSKISCSFEQVVSPRHT